MRKALVGGVLVAALAAVRPAAAVELTTTIDLDYKYEQTNAAGDVDAKVSYRQKYEVKYQTSLSSVFDFTGAARIEIEDGWHTDDAKTTRTSPTLELEASGDQAGLKLSYQSVLSVTDAYHETASIEDFSGITEANLELTPAFWPEVKLKLTDRRDRETGQSESTTRALDLVTRKEIEGLVLEYDLKREWVDDTLPERGDSNSADWKATATYREALWGGTDFELSYEINETYKVLTSRDVFVSDDESSRQKLRTKLQKTVDLSTRMSLKLGWEYTFDQDLLGLKYDTKEKTIYQAQLRWEPMNGVKLSSELKREIGEDAFPLPQDDEQSLADSIVLGADLAPSSLLRISSKASLKWNQAVRDGSGASVDLEREEVYETAVRNKIGDWWQLTVNFSNKTQHEDDWLTSREDKVRGEAEIALSEYLKVLPTYEIERLTEWEVRIEDPNRQKQTRDWKIKFDYRRKYLDLLEVTFAHEYGVKTEDELDAVLDFQSTVRLTEETRLSAILADFIEGLKLEGEIDRRAGDTEDDGDPMTVDVSYAVKLDYKTDLFGFVTTVKYNDKGDNFDDLSVGTRLEVRLDELTVSGEYTFDKVYADELDEKRSMQLRLKYQF